MIVVSHEMGFAREVANRIIFMEDGDIVEAGPPEQLFTQAQQERTRRFLRRLTDFTAAGQPPGSGAARE
jgi:ABC-type polar amino acid transport system ATPase subunit